MNLGRRVLIGVGNEWAGDDGLGPVIVRQAAERLPEDVRVLELDGEPGRLLDAWADAALAVVVDAARLDGRSFVVRDGHDLAVDHRSTSSHGIGLRDAVALGAATNRLPGRLVVVAVGGADFGTGRGLGPAARAHASAAVAEVERLLTCEPTNGGRPAR